MRVLQLPTQSRLNEILSYHPETGVLRWRIDKARKRAGDVAGDQMTNRYWRVSIDGRRYLAHRVIWKMMTGDEPAEVDHRDLDQANNRWLNLRAADRGGNNHNQGMRVNNRSGARGVCFDRRSGRWMARIYVDGVMHWLGYHETVDLGAAAYCEAAKRLVPDFTRVS